MSVCAHGGAGEHGGSPASRIRQCPAASVRFGDGNSRESHQQLAISLASQIALSLSGLQLRDTLRELSIRDPLTRLFNRRFLQESIERELQLASRKNQSIAILFLDLDHFKRFNDTFGHDAGDMVLQSLADLFRSFFRATDICCRYGGEEFAIILPESNSQDAAIRADALRAEVKRLRLRYKKETVGPTFDLGRCGRVSGAWFHLRRITQDCGRMPL